MAVDISVVLGYVGQVQQRGKDPVPQCDPESIRAREKQREPFDEDTEDTVLMSGHLGSYMPVYPVAECGDEVMNRPRKLLQKDTVLKAVGNEILQDRSQTELRVLGRGSIGYPADEDRCNFCLEDTTLGDGQLRELVLVHYFT